MRKFLKRLERYMDLTIDFDGFVPSKAGYQPVQLKAIFDNLRCYTVLAFLVVGIQFLLKAESVFAAYFIGVFTAALSLLVFYQTSIIIIATCIGLISALLPPRALVVVRRKLRARDISIKVAGALFGLPVGIFAGNLLLAIGRALPDLLRSTYG